MNPTAVETRQGNPRERFGITYRGWYDSLAKTTPASIAERQRLEECVAKKLAGTPTTPQEEADKEAEIVKLEAVTDAVQNVVVAGGGTPTEQRAVQGLPDFVQNIFASNPDLLGTPGTPRTDIQERNALLAQTLLHHSLRNPDMDSATIISELMQNLYDQRDLNEPMAAEMLSGVVDEAISHGMSFNPAMETEIDDFLEQEGLERAFENRNQQAPAQTPMVYRRLEDVYASIQQELAGHEADPQYWEAFNQRVIQTVLASEQNKRLVDIKALALNQLLGGVLTAREKVMLLSFSDPLAFSKFYESYSQDPTIQARVQAAYPGVTGAQFQRHVAAEISRDMTEFSMKMVVEIFTDVLSHEPDAEFAAKAQSTGTPEDNPLGRAMLFQGLLTNFGMVARYIEDRSILLNDIALFGREENAVSRVDKASGEVRPYVLPGSRESSLSVSKFAEYMQGVFDSGRQVLEYGHNFKYAIEKGQGKLGDQGPETFYATQIAGFADKYLSSARIDAVYRLPGAEIIQAAAMKYQSKMLRLLYDSGHRYTPELMGEGQPNNQSAIEREIRAELKAQFGYLEEWKLEWAFNMARAEFVGVAFGFHEMISFSDPDLDAQGTPTGRSRKGYGHEGLFSAFSQVVGDNKNPFQGVNGVMFCPYTVDWRMKSWDFERYTKEGEAVWRDTFTVGSAAYDGTLLEGQKLFIDLAGTLVEAGGVFTCGGDTLQMMYEGWLGGELTALQNPKLKKDSASIVTGLKKVETIGIDVVRNYLNELVLDALPTSLQTAGSPSVTTLTEVGDYLFSRYFGEQSPTNPTAHSNRLNPVAQRLLAQYGVTDRSSFRGFLRKVATSREYDGMQKDVLKEVFKAVEVVMIHEQMPSYFVLMERQRDTEYGVTLGSIVEARMAREFGTTTPVEGHTLFKGAMTDLAFVEQQGRMDSMKEMDRNLHDHGNLFGDLTHVRSSIRGGRGNVIDEAYITSALRARFGYATLSTAAERAAVDQRIQRTVSLWKHIGSEIVAEVTERTIVPNGGNPDSAITGNAAIAKLDEKRRSAIMQKARAGRYQTRAQWMQTMLLENRFGHSFTSQATAMPYVRFQGAGENVVKETAIKVGLSAEVIRLKVGSLPMLVRTMMGTENAKTTEEAAAEFFKWMGFKGIIRGICGMDTDPLVNRMTQLITLVFKEDDKVADNINERAKRWSKNEPKAIIDVLNGKPVKTWDVQALRKFTNFLSSRDVGLIPDKAEPKNQKWRTVKLPDKSLIGKIPGVRRALKRVRVRDWPNETSAEAYNNWMRSDERRMTLNVYLPLFLLIAFVMAIAAGKAGINDMKIT